MPGLSHLREHKFRHNFQDILNPTCSCGENIETTTHFLLYLNERMTLLTKLLNIEENILDRNFSRISETLLYDDSSFSNTRNTTILNSTNQYIFDTKRFDVL